MNREEFDELRKIINENNLEETIDNAFMKVKNLTSLGSTDEGHVDYSLEEYWLFADGFCKGYMNAKGVK